MTYASDNREWLEPYITDMAQRMGLPHWQIDLGDEDPNEGSSASTWVSANYQTARMYVSDMSDEIGSNDEALRRNVAHELVHLHVHDWQQAMESILGHLSPSTREVAESMLFRHMERSVDAIAVAWAETLPLPEMPIEAKEAA